ncbi:MAG: 30S ribosomal protein S12 methylthiotransferase RimO [Paenibacillaceae bacterium]|jgi:ribosomal protein S12 methylthiotransferase|nr:30S ribosomal protein S12 methylthiotransferase RimO [Paenibacillaceae bacterium]
MQHTLYMMTLGCDKNVVDSEHMMGIAQHHGMHVVDDAAHASVIIVNTCGFIEAAKEQSIRAILDLADYKTQGKAQALIVTGCLTQRYKQTLMDEIPEIDGIIGTGDFVHIHDVIHEALRGKKPARISAPTFDYEHVLPRTRTTQAHFAHVKISEGCDHACTFCAIPIMRGAFRSRSIASITKEVEALANEGVREIALIAQDVTNYGRDIDGLMLPELLRALANIEPLRWIRLHYMYPGLFTDALLEEIAVNDKVCKYIDMPLQHSEDDILRRMRRPGRQRDVRALIARIRERIPHVALRTSMIVGFPGETDDHFARLLAFVQDMKFDRLGVFSYSLEEDTPAARLSDHVPQSIKEVRAATLMDVQERVSATARARRVGHVVDVLIERYDGRQDVYVGRSEYDAVEIDGEVVVTGAALTVGDIVPVRITHVCDHDLVGVCV